LTRQGLKGLVLVCAFAALLIPPAAALAVNPVSFKRGAAQLAAKGKLKLRVAYTPGEDQEAQAESRQVAAPAGGPAAPTIRGYG